jgi:hypothetical protein
MSKPGGKGVVLGFLTVRPTATEGLRGGYLLTTDYGRPIEFHYTSEFRLTGPERLLFGTPPPEYLHVEMLAQPLTDRQTVAPRIVLVDRPNLLELRRRIPAPVVLIESPSAESPELAADQTRHLAAFRSQTHVEFPDDAIAFERIRELTPSSFDWLEPFDRLAAALAEIRETRSLAG